MKINKDNYEAYFLDYHEGNLKPSEAEELFVFLELHPELNSEFEEFEGISVVPDDAINFPGKESLKKTGIPLTAQITFQNAEDFLIAETEGNLTIAEKEQLEGFIKENPQYNRERQLYRLTLLEADKTVVFAGKESLRHLAIPVGSIHENNYENYLVQELEDSLSSGDLLELDEFMLLNPQFGTDRKLYSLTRLQPDSSINYPDKASLRRTVVPIRRIVFYALSAAASLLILFGVYFSRQHESKALLLSGNTVPGQYKPAPAAVNSKSSPTANHEEIVNLAEIARPAHSKSSGIVNKSAEKSGNNAAVETNRQSGPLNLLASMSYDKIISRDFVEPEFMFIRTSQMRSNEYLELYYNIKLSEQIQYAKLNSKDKNPEKTLLNSLASKVTGLFASNTKTVPEPKEEASIWTFAELGVKTYNSITRNDVKLDLLKDEQGKVVSYSLVGDKLDLQRDMKK